MQEKITKTLCVFDMDYTISQQYLEECLFSHMSPQEYDQTLDKYFKHVEKWPTIVHKVIENYQPQEHVMDSWVDQVGMVTGMKELIQYLHDKMGFSVIIISGGNSLLLKKYLEKKGIMGHIDACFAKEMIHDGSKYVYNPEILSCHLPLCHHGYCKGEILQKYADERAHTTHFERILYFGDGFNDLCGINHIDTGRGYAFIRKDHSLHEKIKKEDYSAYMRCEVMYWSNGFQIIEYLKQQRVLL